MVSAAVLHPAHSFLTLFNLAIVAKAQGPANDRFKDGKEPRRTVLADPGSIFLSLLKKLESGPLGRSKRKKK